MPRAMKVFLVVDCSFRQADDALDNAKQQEKDAVRVVR